MHLIGDSGRRSSCGIEPTHDDRGFISPLFCANEFGDYGLLSGVARMNVADSYARGTLRGIHRQAPPNAEATSVRCTRGAIERSRTTTCLQSMTHQPGNRPL